MKGFDTETLNRPGGGYAVLLVDSDGRYIEFPHSFNEIFAWFNDGDFMAWNADFDIRAILHEHYLPFDVLESLAINGKAIFDGIFIEYIPKKKLILSDGNKRIRLFDLQQFYGSSLRLAAERFLPEDEQKEDIPPGWYNEMDACLKDERREKVLSYALRDAALIPRLFEPMRESFEALGVSPSSWTSPASLAAVAFKADLEKLKRLPGNVQEFFRRAFFGGRIEVRGLGSPMGDEANREHLEKVGQNDLTLYDINSAYPSAAARLMDPSGALLVNVGPGGEPPDPAAALYGAYAVRVHVPKTWTWGPLAVRQQGEVSYPVGDVRTYCGKDALLSLYVAGLNPTIERGWEFWPQIPPKPLFPRIIEFFNARKDPRLKLAAKLLLNSLYGKLCETRDKYIIADDFDWYRSQWFSRLRVRSHLVYGRYCWFPVAAAITEAIRMELWRVAREHETYMMMTDSVLIRGAMPTGENMGEWSKKSDVSRAVIYGAGRYRLIAPDNSETIHLRGFAPTDENFSRLENCPTRTCKLKDLRTGGFQGWVKGGGLTDFNVLADVEMVYNPEDKKRFYPRRPQTVESLGRQWFPSNAWISRLKEEKWKKKTR